jgi:carboxymethylenebutenolidase
MPDLSNQEERASFFQAVRPLMARLTPDALARDGAAYLDFLAQFATEPVAITGYCMGARLGWRIAGAHPDRVTAYAGFHGGGLVTDAPDSPHLSAGEIRGEVYFGHADQDPSMTAEQIAVLERALADARVPHVTEVYEGAVHGYTMADSPAYNEAAAERHFDRLFGLLERTLGVRA